MMGPNFLMIPVAALIPMVVGFVWYNPKVFGTIWMKETGVTEEKAQQANMAVTFGLAYLFACMLGVVIMGMSIHQMGVVQLFATKEGFDQAGSEAQQQFATVMGMVGTIHLSFGHGLLHGTLGGLFAALPILATNALFEMKSWKYIWINVGYWIISMALMGGVLCQWGWNAG